MYKSETSHSYATENERKWSDATRVTGSDVFLRDWQPGLNKPDHFQSLKRINSLLKMFETTDTTQSKVTLVAGCSHNTRPVGLDSVKQLGILLINMMVKLIKCRFKSAVLKQFDIV